MQEGIERKVVYQHSENDEVRAIRGVVRIEGDFVIVERRDGELWIPVHRVFWIERFPGGERQ